MAPDAGLLPSDRPLPLVLVSHGAGGSAGSYGWLAEYLARNGFVVLGVAHRGESPVYGPDSIDPRVFTQLWLRPPDCIFALDRLLEQPDFRTRVDGARVGALGHSSGGATVIALAGAAFDPSALSRYCQSEASTSDHGCDYARGLPMAATAPVSCRDLRVAAIVALDPAAGPGFSAASLAALDVRALVVGATENDFLPFKHHAGHYAASIPNAELITLHRNEGHFVYLNVCISAMEANGVPLCSDRDGVDREAVHADLAPRILAFLRSALGP